jgi:lysophospholipase L1-like esterase
VEIRAVAVPVIHLLGDSTVTDQPTEPWNSWGQMLPRCFGPGIAVANHAESGESIRSSLSAGRFEKVYRSLKKGDHVLVQFGHYDMKDQRPDALETYRANLAAIVKEVRELGGTPVLVTSMERKAGVMNDTLGGYPDAVRSVARELGVPLIDLHAMSRTLYQALGDNIGTAFQDGTHHNNYGSYELAKCVVEGIRAEVPELAKQLRPEVNRFDPARPDPPGDFRYPPSPVKDLAKPDGD